MASVPQRTKRARKPKLKPIAVQPFPRAQQLLLPIIARTFEELEVSASLRLDDDVWHAIHLAPSVIAFEAAHGVDTLRWDYNEHCFQRGVPAPKIVLGQHAGFWDFFVPVRRDDVSATLVVGPFSRSRPSSGEVLERWRALTRTHGRVSDPGFSEYLSMTLATLTLEGPLLDDFRRFLACFAQLLEAQPTSEQLLSELSQLVDKLREARYAERMWRAVPTMVDSRTSHGWASRATVQQLWTMGVKRLPQHVVVGLLVGSDNALDPIDDALRRDAFQRACAAFAKKRGGVVCGRLSNYGVVLLTDDVGKGSHLRAKLLDLSRRALTLARRFGLRLHAGLSSPDDPASLPERYQRALAAAEQALSKDVSFEYAEAGAARKESAMAAVRQRLVRTASESPQRISPLFARFVEAVAAHCAHRLEPARAHLEAGFDLLIDALRSTANLDERSLTELRAVLERNLASANTLRDLAAAYQPIVADLVQAVVRPIEAGQDRALRRALEFVREHLNEPLPLARVARVAGFAPRYFAKLLVKDEHMTLHDYVGKLRLARAKQLLSETLLTVEHVQQLSGFRNRVHFHRAFKRAFGVTPSEYRSANA